MGLTFPLGASVVVDWGVQCKPVRQLCLCLHFPWFTFTGSQRAVTARLSHCHFWLDDSPAAREGSDSYPRIGIQETGMVDCGLLG